MMIYQLEIPFRGLEFEQVGGLINGESDYNMNDKITVIRML